MLLLPPQWIHPVSGISGPVKKSVSEQAHHVLANYGLGNASVAPLGTGLINETFLVSSDDGSRYVLQRINPVFNPKIICDMDKLTRHLESCGEITHRPILVSQEPRRLWVELDGRYWRLCTYIPGVCHDRLENDSQAESAGRLLGRFHSKVSGLQISLQGERLGVHDTARHLANLEKALDEHRAHRNYDTVAPLAERVLTAAAELPQLPDLPDRLVHGDPKISNLVFDATSGVGVCMIDLDTLAYMPLPLELGDAIRSWCNPRGEDERESRFNMNYFIAAMKGYASETKTLLIPDEWRSFVPAASTIMVELAARFTTDALEESYFGWNAERFVDRSAHNLIRAEGQLNLQRAFAADQVQAQAAVLEAFADKG
jgi:Ser/Thr protein kinase RdoA (MazF antagonist)